MRRHKISGTRERRFVPCRGLTGCGSVLALWLMASAPAQDPWRPPLLPGGQALVTDRSSEFLKPIGPLATGITIATTPPAIDFFTTRSRLTHGTRGLPGVMALR